MFADDKSIENMQQLFIEFKKYLELQKEYTKLEVTEKLSKLRSTLLLVLLVVIDVYKRQEPDEPVPQKARKYL